MIPAFANIQYDTSVLVHLLRGKRTGVQIFNDYQLGTRVEKAFISIVTAGEILSFAAQSKWGAQRINDMYAYLHELAIVGLDDFEIAEIYSDLDTSTRRCGLTVSHNDLWIAATALNINAYLLTSDRDFLPLADLGVRVEWVDPAR
ncbi:type II toxin-antitoxin system VapC family toxin [bacterium]|nr:type II toxin-antitoxin system VapC family toxin [bacterium]